MEFLRETSQHLASLSLLSENVFRRIDERKEISFDSVIRNTNITGASSFGFSGEGNIYKFSFLSGRILDPDDNYVSSYFKNEPIKISGNINENEHSYYINQTPFQLSGAKTSYKMQRFFANANDVSMDLDMYVFGFGPAGLSASFDSEIDDGEVVDVTVTNTGNSISFHVYSGYFEYPWDEQLKILNFPFDVSTTEKMQVSGNGMFPKLIEPDLTLFTSFGKVSVTGLSVDRSSSSQTINLSASFNNPESFSNFQGEPMGGES